MRYHTLFSWKVFVIRKINLPAFKRQFSLNIKPVFLSKCVMNDNYKYLYNSIVIIILTNLTIFNTSSSFIH